MRIFDSTNPLWTPSAVGAVVSFIPNKQGAPHPALVLTGNVHITAYNLLAHDTDVINPVYSTLTLAGVVAGDTCVVYGQTYTCVASGAVANQFNVGGTDAISATNLAAAIAANLRLGIGSVFRANSPKLMVEIQASADSGSVGVTGALEVSINGTDFVTHPQLAASNLSGTPSAYSLSAQIDGYPFVRANISALSGVNAVARLSIRGIDFN